MMDEQIPENIKKERARQLLKLSKELKLKYFEKFIGRFLPGPSWSGRSSARSYQCQLQLTPQC